MKKKILKKTLKKSRTMTESKPCPEVEIQKKLTILHWKYGPCWNLFPDRAKRLMKKFNLTEKDLTPSRLRTAENDCRSRLRQSFMDHNANPERKFDCYIVGDPIVGLPLAPSRSSFGSPALPVEGCPKADKATGGADTKPTKAPVPKKAEAGVDKWGFTNGTGAAKINKVLSRKALSAKEIEDLSQCGRSAVGHLAKLIRLGKVEKTSNNKFRLVLGIS